LLLFVILNGCQNLDNFEINSVKEPLVVLNANLVARQSPKIYVGKLWGATTPRPAETFYRNADVELFENGKSVGKLMLKDTLYQNTNYIIKPNTKYVIKVLVQGIKPVESEPVLIPADGIISDIIYLQKSPFNSTNTTIGNPSLVTVIFEKNIQTAMYGIQLLAFGKEEERLFLFAENIDLGTQTSVKSPCLLDSYCPDIDLKGEIGTFIYRGKTAYLMKCIDSPTKTLRFVTTPRSSPLYPTKNNPQRDVVDISKFIVTLTATSQEGIELARTTKIVEGFQAALTEPYPTYSNVKGGLGIVIGYNVTYKVLTIN
jgi:Domain of unknown function (DUF4249)